MHLIEREDGRLVYVSDGVKAKLDKAGVKYHHHATVVPGKQRTIVKVGAASEAAKAKGRK